MQLHQMPLELRRLLKWCMLRPLVLPRGQGAKKGGGMRAESQ